MEWERCPKAVWPTDTTGGSSLSTERKAAPVTVDTATGAALPLTPWCHRQRG